MSKGVLVPLSWVYSFGHAVRRCAYSIGLARAYRPPVRTVSVGNITVGGTGKSPLVEFLCTRLKEQGVNAAVVRRDRAAWPSNADLTDELRVFSENVPDVPQYAGSSKSECVRQACVSDPDVVVVDDGFQTLSLQRDLDIIVINATAPFGNGRLIPAGTLREPVRALSRAGAVVLNHSSDITPEDKKALVARIGEQTSAGIFEAEYVVDSVKNLSGESVDLSAMKDKRVFAFCGIGSPGGFICTLEGMGCIVEGKSVFQDHHVYSAADLLRIREDADKCGAEMIVTTQKDAVRLDLPDNSEMRICYPRIRIEVQNGDELCKMVTGE